MPSVLVTGANRGIGLGFVDQYASEGWRVHACCRAPDAADELKSLTGDIEVHALNVTDVTAIKALAAEIDTPLDGVIANAGVMGDAANDFGSIDFDAWDEAFAVNVRAVVAMAEAFAPHLEKASGKFAALSSTMGSIADSSGGYVCYRSTKAAVNMAVSAIAPAFERKGVAAAPFHPGWVQTDMGGRAATVPVDESVAGLRGLIARMKPSAKPLFLDYAGVERPW